MRVLNVGSGSEQIGIPKHYASWEHHRLDRDPNTAPDVLLDAGNLAELPPSSYDAVYCSHTSEHFPTRGVSIVLKGFSHVLKPSGFAGIAVPDIPAVVQHMVSQRMNIEDTLYRSPAGPIPIRDVMYGLGREMEMSGHNWYSHKTDSARN